MALETRKVKMYAIVQMCEKCNKGFYQRDEFSPILATYPAQYRHVCNECGDVKTFFDIYPKIEYEIEGNTKMNNDLNKLIDEIESIDWYHIGKNGELVHGANSKEEGTEPLYKAEDILKILDRYRDDEDEDV